MNAAGLLDEVPPGVWDIDWNVNCQAVGESSASLKDLAPYVFKVAISNSRIVGLENRVVTFRYKRPHACNLYRLQVNRGFRNLATHSRNLLWKDGVIRHLSGLMKEVQL